MRNNLAMTIIVSLGCVVGCGQSTPNSVNSTANRRAEKKTTIPQIVATKTSTSKPAKAVGQQQAKKTPPTNAATISVGSQKPKATPKKKEVIWASEIWRHASKLALEPKSHKEGAAVVQVQANGSANQQWQISGNGPIIHAASGLALTAEKNGGVTLQKRNNKATQNWHVRTRYLSYRKVIQHQATGLFLQVLNKQDRKVGAVVGLGRDVNWWHQFWEIRKGKPKPRPYTPPPAKRPTYKPDEKITAYGQHRSLVNSLAYSPDGKYIVTGSTDSTIQVTDARKTYTASPNFRTWATRRTSEVYTLKAHSTAVTSVKFSPDGKRIVSASLDQTLKVWDVETGKRLLTLTGHKGPVLDVAYSPDGKTIASAGQDGTLKLWNADTGEELKAIKTGHNLSVTCVCYSPDGKQIVTGGGRWSDRTSRFPSSGNYQVKLWDAHTGEWLKSLTGHAGSIWCVTISPDGKCIVSGSADSTRVWDVRSGKLATALGVGVLSVAFSPDGKRLATAGTSVKLWDRDWNPVLSSPSHGTLWSVAFSPDGNQMAVCGNYAYKKRFPPVDYQYSVHVWNTQVFDHLRAVIAISPNYETSVEYTRKHRIVSRYNGSTLTVHEGLKAPLTFHFRQNKKFSGKVVSSSDGKPILKVFDHAKNKQTLSLPHENAIVNRTLIDVVKVSPDGTRIACLSSIRKTSGKRHFELNVWDARTEKPLFTLPHRYRRVESMSYSPDGKRLVSAGNLNETGVGYRGELKVWDAKTGKALLSVPVNSSIYIVAHSPDGKRIVTREQMALLTKSHTATFTFVKVRNAETGKVLFSFEQPGLLFDVAYSVNGRYVVCHVARFAAGGSRLSDAMLLWDVRSKEQKLKDEQDELNRKKPVLTLSGHKGVVRAVAYSPDGKHIASGDDKTLRLWDARNGKLIRTFPAYVRRLAYSPDGKRVVICGFGEIKLGIWDTQTGKCKILRNRFARDIYSVAYSPDGKYVASGSIGFPDPNKTGKVIPSEVKIWDAQSGKAVISLKGHPAHVSVHSVAFSPDGKLLVAAAGIGELTRAPIDVQKRYAALKLWQFSNGGLTVWRTDTGKKLFTQAPHYPGVNYAAFSPDGKRIISGGAITETFYGSGPIAEVNLGRAENSKQLKRESGLLLHTHLAYSSDGKYFATSSKVGLKDTAPYIMLWDAQTGKQLEVFRSGGASCLAFSPDSRFLVSGSSIELKIWRVPSAK